MFSFQTFQNELASRVHHLLSVTDIVPLRAWHDWDPWGKGWIMLRPLLRGLIGELTRRWTRIPKELRVVLAVKETTPVTDSDLNRARTRHIPGDGLRNPQNAFWNAVAVWLLARWAALKLSELLFSKSDGELCIQRFYFGLCGEGFCFFFPPSLALRYLSPRRQRSDRAVITTIICDWKEPTSAPFFFLMLNSDEKVMKQWKPFLKTGAPPKEALSTGCSKGIAF